jgi:mannitol/fructose-specific phosphotransferase system IIA component (Ntr-type)
MVCRTVHEHLRLLARLASALRGDAFRQVLARRPAAAEIVAALRREETV